jgi:hypothetical protein
MQSRKTRQLLSWKKLALSIAATRTCDRLDEKADQRPAGRRKSLAAGGILSARRLRQVWANDL